MRKAGTPLSAIKHSTPLDNQLNKLYEQKAYQQVLVGKTHIAGVGLSACQQSRSNAKDRDGTSTEENVCSRVYTLRQVSGMGISHLQM